jgi:hypothetical protein
VLSFWPNMPHKTACWGALFLALVFCPRVHATDSDCAPKTNEPLAEIGQPPNLGGLKDQLRYYKCSGAYDRDFSQVIDQAISYVVKRTPELAKESKGRKPAIVLDIDETSLSNWVEIQADDFGRILNGPCTLEEDYPCGEVAWQQRAEATKLDTIRLFNKARELNVAVFFISGRPASMQNATEQNLVLAGYSGWTDPVKLRPDNQGSVEGFKTAARKEIENRGYKIIANVGDQYSDLRGGYAEQVFKVPNPFYFIP